MRMSRYEETVTAVLDLLRSIGADTVTPISNLKIGPPLVENGFSESEIADALIRLDKEKVIELVEGNQLRLVKPF